MNRSTIIDRLNKLDMEAFLADNSDDIYRVVIVGGSGLVLLEVLSRATKDIDILEAPSVIYNLIEKYDANMRVSAYINNFPFNYEDRLVKIEAGGRKLLFYSASLEDIVIAKLCSMRDTDRQDVLSPDILRHVDWERLDRLAMDENEMKASSLNDRQYHDFLYDYREYVRRCKPHEGANI